LTESKAVPKPIIPMAESTSTTAMSIQVRWVTGATGGVVFVMWLS
jgi:hypothetical protein